MYQLSFSEDSFDFRKHNDDNNDDDNDYISRFPTRGLGDVEMGYDDEELYKLLSSSSANSSESEKIIPIVSSNEPRRPSVRFQLPETDSDDDDEWFQTSFLMPRNVSDSKEEQQDNKVQQHDSNDNNNSDNNSYNDNNDNNDNNESKQLIQQELPELGGTAANNDDEIKAHFELPIVAPKIVTDFELQTDNLSLNTNSIKNDEIVRRESFQQSIKDDLRVMSMSMSSFSSPRAITPLKNAVTVVSIANADIDDLKSLSSVGSVGSIGSELM